MKITLLLLVLFLIACDDSTSDDKKKESDLSMNYEKTIKNTTFQIYSKNKTYNVGYNKFYIKILNDQKELIKNSELSILPMMDMGMMKHTTPTENPKSTVSNSDGYFETACSFIMSGMWKLTVKHILITFPIAVQGSTNARPPGILWFFPL